MWLYKGRHRSLITARTKSRKRSLKRQSKESHCWLGSPAEGWSRGTRENPPEAIVTWWTVAVTVIKTQEMRTLKPWCSLWKKYDFHVALLHLVWALIFETCFLKDVFVRSLKDVCFYVDGNNTSEPTLNTANKSQLWVHLVTTWEEADFVREHKQGQQWRRLKSKCSHYLKWTRFVGGGPCSHSINPHRCWLFYVPEDCRTHTGLPRPVWVEY